jgi:hypothetical protein
MQGGRGWGSGGLGECVLHAGSLGPEFTCFTSTKVHLLTQKVCCMPGRLGALTLLLSLALLLTLLLSLALLLALLLSLTLLLALLLSLTVLLDYLLYCITQAAEAGIEYVAWRGT